MKVLQSIQEDMAQQKQDMRNMEENIKEAINKKIDEKFTQIENKTYQLEQKIEHQQRSIDFLDKQLRMKNLVFFGVNETEKYYDDLHNMILDIIHTKMNIRCQTWEIATVSRKGKRDGRTRPVIVTLTTTSRKLELLRNKKTLNDTGIYIKEDFSPAVIQKRKELQEDLKRERDSGKNVVLRYDKLITLDRPIPVRREPTEKQSNKRLLSESPEAAESSKTNSSEDRKRPTQKKNKPQTITNYLRPALLNPTARASTSRDVHEYQKN